MEPSTYRLPELADAAGVTPRTVRYYIAQGLLPSPGRLGAGTRYGSEHLGQLHLIRRLQDQGLSLAEIRERLEVQPTPMLAEAPPPPGLDPSRAMFRSVSAGAQGTSPGERSVWERVVLAPGVEVHVRRPHNADSQRLVNELLRVATWLRNPRGSS